MPHHSHAQLTGDLYRQTEEILQQAVSEWQVLPPEMLSARPADGGWSAAQCLEHLNIYGRYYLPAIEKAIGRARPAKEDSRFRSGWLGGYFTRLMRPGADGMPASRMKAPKNAVPAEAPDPRAMLAEFIDQQERMLTLLTAAETLDLGSARIPVSIAPFIRLKLGDTFGFMVAHVQRHVLQAERAVSSVSLRKSVAG
ncbi:MAG: DinB family protein [Lewinellaceae bacterium]|nr:DinB family protein [Lewinellaceae bacterium]